MARASRGRVAGKSQAEATVIEGQPPLGRYRQVSSMLEEFRLAPRLGHCHDLQQVAVRVLEVETAPAPAGVDLAVGVAVWATASPVVPRRKAALTNNAIIFLMCSHLLSISGRCSRR